MTNKSSSPLNKLLGQFWSSPEQTLPFLFRVGEWALTEIDRIRHWGFPRAQIQSICNMKREVGRPWFQFRRQVFIQGRWKNFKQTGRPILSLLDGGEEALFSFRAFRSGFDATLHAEEVLVVTQRLAAFAAEPLAQFQEDLLLDLRPLLEKFASRVRSYRALKR